MKWSTKKAATQVRVAHARARMHAYMCAHARMHALALEGLTPTFSPRPLSRGPIDDLLQPTIRSRQVECKHACVHTREHARPRKQAYVRVHVQARQALALEHSAARQRQKREEVAATKMQSTARGKATRDAAKAT